jgi:hypothetical protein
VRLLRLTALYAMLGELHASNDWRGVADEYFHGAQPPTPMGKLDREFFGNRDTAVG